MSEYINLDDFWKSYSSTGCPTGPDGVVGPAGITGPDGVTQNSKKTYLGRIPSRDFWDEAYQLFLEFATPEELETDTLTRETLQKISKTLGYE